MQKFIQKRIVKAIIDLLLLVGLVLSMLSAKYPGVDSWGSFHCIVSMTWYVLMLVHIWQHWAMTKALRKWTVLKRNIITAVTVFVFILMTSSIILFVFDINEKAVDFHHAVAALFRIVVIVHTIQKTKQFKLLFKKKKHQ